MVLADVGQNNAGFLTHFPLQPHHAEKTILNVVILNIFLHV